MHHLHVNFYKYDIYKIIQFFKLNYYELDYIFFESSYFWRKSDSCDLNKVVPQKKRSLTLSEIFHGPDLKYFSIWYDIHEWEYFSTRRFKVYVFSCILVVQARCTKVWGTWSEFDQNFRNILFESVIKVFHLNINL